MKISLLTLLVSGLVLSAHSLTAQTVDVTATVKGLVNHNALTVSVNNELINNDRSRDPAVGVQKKLKVEYSIDAIPSSRAMTESGTLVIKAPEGKTLTVTKAVYGILQDKYVNVTEKLAAAIKANTLSIIVNNGTMGGDPCYSKEKELRVNYTVDGKPHKLTISERENLTLPLESDGKGSLVILNADYGFFE